MKNSATGQIAELQVMPVHVPEFDTMVNTLQDLSRMATTVTDPIVLAPAPSSEQKPAIIALLKMGVAHNSPAQRIWDGGNLSI